MLGQQSLFSSQDQLQEIHDVSEFNPVIMQQSEPQQEAQNDPRLYYEQCPKHGGPNRSPESHEDIVGSLATRPDDMVVGYVPFGDFDVGLVTEIGTKHLFLPMIR